jgi:hypothetical protein
MITHSGIITSSSCSVPANRSTVPVAMDGDWSMADGVLDPVKDPAERCASCSTRLTISVAALSACSSASICCTLRLRLGVLFVVIDMRDSCSSLVVSLSAA